MFGAFGGLGGAAIIYFFAHFLLYVSVLRHRPYFRTEKGIFLYHLISAMIFVFVAVVIFLIRRDGEALSFGSALIAAHGIYSISFLELWSLAQGSYSLSIMGRHGSDGGLSRTELIDAFFRIGNAKKADRLSSLAGSKLVLLEGTRWRLTGTGATVAAVLKSLLWLANIKERG
jgi:hypothetical protein